MCFFDVQPSSRFESRALKVTHYGGFFYWHVDKTPLAEECAAARHAVVQPDLADKRRHPGDGYQWQIVWFVFLH